MDVSKGEEVAEATRWFNEKVGAEVMGADEGIGDKHSGAGREWGRWHMAMVSFINTTSLFSFSLSWLNPRLWRFIGCAEWYVRTGHQH